MGILSTIFGTGDVITKGFELIDDMYTSKEEEIQAKVKGKVDLLNAYAPFKVAQRYIALLFTFTFLFCFVLVLSFTLFDIGNPKDVMDVLSQFYIGQIMLTIVGFYFGGGFIEGMFTAKNKPKGKNKQVDFK